MSTNNGTTTVTPQPGGIVRQGMAGTELEVRETAAVAVAEREKAAIQALFLMAAHRPRDWDLVRTKLLKDAQRYGFADSALWEIERGKNADGTPKLLTGPSIRFAEAAIRAMGNVFVDMQVTLDAPDRRKVQVVIIDLENLVRFSREVQIEKTVERKFLPKDFDQKLILGKRKNSYGDQLFIIPATEDEVVQKQAVAVSKVLRTEGLRLLPGDIMEEAIAACEATIAKGIKDDPDKAKKLLIDSFAKLNVTPADLATFLGHPVAQVQPAELIRLRAIYNAIYQGETTWPRVMQEKAENEGAQVKAPPAPSGAQPAAENRGPNVAASTTTEATKEPAQATEAKQATPRAADPAPNLVTGEVVLRPEEQAFADAVSAAKAPVDVIKLMPKVNAMPEGRKPWAREVMNARMKELAPVKGND
jgi:hypothetical protein